MSYQEMVFTFLGGLGIFLFGIKYLGDGLQKAAGNRLKEILNRFTSTPFRAVVAGIVVTGLIQSSSGTTVLAVGLVSAGFMTLRQAIGVIMGANVGTTVTAFIIGFNLSAYALPIIGLGAILLFFCQTPYTTFYRTNFIWLWRTFLWTKINGKRNGSPKRSSTIQPTHDQCFTSADFRRWNWYFTYNGRSKF